MKSHHCRILLKFAFPC